MKYRRIAVILAAIALVTGLAVFLRPDPVIPKEISKVVTFSVFLPGKDIAAIDKESVKYNSTEKLLTYVIKVNGVSAVVSEQPTPEQFTDIPQVYDKVLSSFNQYKSFEVPAGRVYLARPTNLGGKQAAIMNAKGTLMFVKPDRNLSEDDWRRLFRSLQIK